MDRAHRPPVQTAQPFLTISVEAEGNMSGIFLCQQQQTLAQFLPRYSGKRMKSRIQTPRRISSLTFNSTRMVAAWPRRESHP